MIRFRLSWRSLKIITSPVTTVMAGIPGAGKSEAAARIAQRTGALHVNLDRVVDQVGREKMPDKVRAMVNEANARDQSVILDGTYYRRAYRKSASNWAKELGQRPELVAVDTPLEEAIRRNAQRPPEQQVPEAVIRHIDAEFEPVLSKEGFRNQWVIKPED